MTDILTLGEAVTVQRGTTYKSALIGQPGPVLLGLGTIQRNGGFRSDSLRTYGGNAPEKLLVRPGELYASLKDVTQSADLLGAVARVPLDGPTGRLTQDTVRLDLTGVVGADYLYWILRTPQYRAYCHAHATGTTNLGLPRDDFFAFRFPAPSAWARSLVALLGALDDKLESNRCASTLIDQLAREIFQDWRSGVGVEEQTSLGAFADVFGGATPKTAVPDYWEGDVAWATPTDVTALSEPYLFETARRITDVGLASCAAVLHPPGTLFMTSRATIGAFAINQVPAATNQGFIAVRPRRSEDRWFLFEEMRSRVSEFLDNANGSTFLEISRGRFKELSLAVPPATAIDELADHLQPLHDKAAQLSTESQRLARLRDVLLPALLSGRIRVPEAAAVVQDGTGLREVRVGKSDYPVEESRLGTAEMQ